MRALWILVLLLLLPVGASSVPCLGQSSAPSEGGNTGNGHGESLFRKGIQLAKAGKYQKSLSYLRPLFESDTASLGTRKGKALTYWLGTAYSKQGQPKKALSVWREGVWGEHSRYAGIDVRLADAFIWAVMRQRRPTDYARAADVYLRLLGTLDSTDISSEEEAVVRQHLRELAVILPNDLQEQTGVHFDRESFEITINRASNAGEMLVEWWRGQDPLPATRDNERIHEHLRRVLYAKKHYTHDGTMDDRGKLYIRFGEPRRNVSVGRKDRETINSFETRLRKNEFWTYPGVDQNSAYFLLIEKQPHEFAVGNTTDLFPPDLTPGREYLYLMEQVLRQLATFHGDYGIRSAEVFDRAAQSRNNEQYGAGTSPTMEPPSGFVRKMETRIETVDRQNARRRTEQVPPSHTRVLEKYPDLPVASRTARFLTSEGKTKFEIYWSIPTSSLALTEEMRERIEGVSGKASAESPEFALLSTALQESPDHVDEHIQNRRYVVSPSSKKKSVLSPETISMIVDDSVFHVATQWNQHIARDKEGTSEQLGTILRRHTERYDTLSALRRDPGTLEMSDLKPLTVPEKNPVSSITSGQTIPYPFEQMNVTQPLALSFEVYHLTFNAQDQTRYTVSYEVGLREEGDRFLGLFGGDQKQSTTATTHQGKSRREKEYILLDLQSLIGEATGNMEVTVKVVDENTGQEVSRSLRFRLTSPE